MAFGSVDQWMAVRLARSKFSQHFSALLWGAKGGECNGMGPGFVGTDDGPAAPAGQPTVQGLKVLVPELGQMCYKLF